MRTEPVIDAIDDETVQIVDWKESPASVLEAVDFLLKRHGLEVVQLETGDDSYTFRIEKRA